MAKEIIIPYNQIDDPQTITRINQAIFEKHGVDVNFHEVLKVEDNHDDKVRVLKVKNTKYFT